MSIDKHLERLEKKIDDQNEHLCSIDVTLMEQKTILAEHTRRSLSNEEAVKTLKDELKPVFTHISIMNFLGKIALTVLGSDLVWEIFKLINK